MSVIDRSPTTPHPHTPTPPPLNTYKLLLVLGLIASASAKLSGQNVMMRSLDRFNVIVTNNYSAGGETEGSAFVGGTFTQAAGVSQFGFNGGAVSDDRTNALFLNNGVAGGSSNTTRLLTGSLASRVAVNTSRFSLNGNAANNPSFNVGTAAWDAALGAEGFSSTGNLIQNVESASSQWNALTKNSVGAVANGNEYRFTAASSPTVIDGRRTAVFSVNGSTAFGSGIGQLSGSGFAGADTILINVSGVSLTVAQNFIGDLQNNERKVIFNFYEATTLNLNRNFRGTVYAPLATVNQNGSNIDGGVVARNFNQTAEVHALNFRSSIPFTAVPEPSSFGMACIAMAGMVFFRKRRQD